jgi:tRNA A-37 threonylcarbamoyl transferase component Bud32/tetratricopeptide (TPR) repeat protein
MQPGHTVAQYEIVEKLGQGGMGVVYRARDTKLDRTVALKFLPPHLSLDEDAKLRFVQEAKAASALDHTNICTIHDIAETDQGELYIVMALYEGQTLGYRLSEEDFSVDRCLSIGVQLARALERAHEAGIVHRDLKPANVLVTDRDEVKLLDFGLAKLTSSRQDLTRTGTTLGTAGYMSPEQLDGGDVDPRADLFSLGAVLYELLAGRRAFDGGTPMATAVAVLQAEPTSLSELRPEVPDSVRRIVEACLCKAREDRPESASAVLAALEGFGAALGGATPFRARKHNRGILIGAGTLAVAALVVVGILMQQTGPDAPLDPNLLAVMPFSVGGSAEWEYLGEGMVDLMSTKLDGAGALTTVSPRVVIARATAEGRDVTDPETHRRVAATLGAGRYVTGEILEVAGRITISVYLNETSGDDGSPEQATTEGATSELFTLLDGLVANLLASSMSGEADRIQRLATLTTASLPAAKEYLQGEQHLRAGRYREAAVAYDGAVAIDSTFALAYYRKSIAADWTDAYDVRSSADRAVELSGVLSARDRSLIQALQLRRNGRVEAAEQEFRAIVHDYPNDVEAWVQLGEAIFHDTSRRGGSTLDAIAPFSKAVELEPANLIAQLHVARLYALYDSTEALSRTADFFRDYAPESERALEVEAIQAYLAGDSAQQVSVKNRLLDKPWFYHFYAVHGVSRFARDAHGAADILAAVPAEDPFVMALVPGIAVVRGKHEEAYAYLDQLRGLDNATWDLFQAFMLSSGTLPLDTARAGTLAPRLATLDAAEIHATSFIPPYEDLTIEHTRFQRDYFLALLWIDLGRMDEARALLDDMKGRDGFSGLGSIKEDAERHLEAELLARSGDRQGALEVLRTVDYQTPHATTVWPMADLGRSRFLRAELERELGDVAVARRFYIGLDEPWSPWDSYWRPLIYERLGQLAEDEGRVDEAVLYYGRLLELWRDCDADLVANRDEIRARHEALLGGSPLG